VMYLKHEPSSRLSSNIGRYFCIAIEAVN